MRVIDSESLYRVPELGGLYRISDDGEIVTIKENFKFLEKNPTYKFFSDAIHDMKFEKTERIATIISWFKEINSFLHKLERCVFLDYHVPILQFPCFGINFVFTRTPCFNTLAQIYIDDQEFPSLPFKEVDYIIGRNGLIKDIKEGRVCNNYDGSCYVGSRRGASMIFDISTYLEKRLLLENNEHY